MDHLPSYEYSSLPGNDFIRLIRLHHAPKHDSRIVASLETHRLDDAIVNYTALSYSWGRNLDGDASLSRQIVIDNCVLAVTENLYDGLLQLRDQPVEPSSLLWIDAICINQADIEERNTQVAMMATIYSRARSLTIWLGNDPEAAKDDIAFETICALSLAIQDSKQGWNRYSGAINKGIIPPAPPMDIRRPKHALNPDCSWLMCFHPRLASPDTTIAQATAFSLGYLCATHSAKDWDLAKYKARPQVFWPRFFRFALSATSDFDSIWRMTARKLSPRAWGYIDMSVYIRDSFGDVFLENLAAVLRVRTNALTSLLSRRYFNRRWIVQEILQSRPEATIVRWGKHFLMYKRFFDLVRMLYDSPWSEFERETLTNLPSLDLTGGSIRSYNNRFKLTSGPNGADMLFNLSEVTTDRVSGHLDRLPGHTQALYFLIRFRSTLCADQRDVLYALSSMCDSIPRPDYSVSTSAAYTAFAAGSIRDGYLESVLSTAGYQVQFESEARRRNHPDLPSWVPDYSNGGLRILTESYLRLNDRWRKEVEVSTSGRILHVRAKVCSIMFSATRHTCVKTTAAGVVAIQHASRAWESDLLLPGDVIADIGRFGGRFKSDGRPIPDDYYILRPIENSSPDSFRLIATNDFYASDEMATAMRDLFPRWINIY